MAHIGFFDLSLKETGFCVFDEKENLISYSTIPTSPSDESSVRLRQIGMVLNELNKKYKFKLVVFEKGFTSFTFRTNELLFKVHGVASYIFWNKKQVYISPLHIKKVVTGSGKADKEKVRQAVLEKLNIPNDLSYDVYDSIALAITYFEDERNK